jgi:hypothetical protein
MDPHSFSKLDPDPILIFTYKKSYQEEEESAEELEQSKGISWGMSDDAEEFPDMEQVRVVCTYYCIK